MSTGFWARRSIATWCSVSPFCLGTSSNCSMCGIAGRFGRGQGPEPRQVDSCLRSMRHRGPDHQAFRRWTNQADMQIDLLHARLNIIDLSDRANQPLRVASKWITFNGELYNYVEL